MARPATGTILTRALTDGTVQFRVRFRANGRRQDAYLHERRDCGCGCGGGWNERTVRVELDNILARAKAGVWRPSPPPARRALTPTSPDVPTFEAYAADWLVAKRDGVLGDKPLGDSTYGDYRWRLRCHLLPFFGRYGLDEIDRELCLAFKARVLREAQELRELLGAGAVVRDRRGRGRVPIGPASLKKIIQGLQSILDEAVEDGHIDTNPARGRRMRVHVPKPKRTFLEIDELACLEDAAGSQDPPLAGRVGAHTDEVRPGKSRGLVAERVAGGMAPHRIAAELGLAKSTVSHHLGRLRARPRRYDGRRAIVTTLGRWRPGQRALRPADRTDPPPRPVGRPVSDPRRKDRGRHPRSADEPRRR